ncbi:hypothetical protein KDW_10490 [Dictyobacter vulcani]|uniref:histidine kinase n=1 Tax=Dictyobacter vulcani TaxID=2607529 RepID=A0A5J4KKC1_9CHLR|nr:sensor histidine kinase [Dictyobacter vulcani]GER86887.1 hypothetical protein KDW_10490 [Dictyobacter vulcani]
MSQSGKIFRARNVPVATLRRLRVIPSYFFLIWRWGMWLYAFIVIVFSQPSYIDTPGTNYHTMAALLLTITFIETLIVTLYAPVLQIVFPRLLSRASRQRKKQGRREHLHEQLEDGAEILPPFVQTRNHYWNIAIYSMDVVICGLVMYFSGPFSNPPFGLGSPFYRYGMSTVFAAASAFSYKGGLLAALGYNLFALLGMFVHAPGAVPYTPNAVDVVGSLVDTPILAVLVAYLSNLLENYAHSKRQERENARTQAALVHIGETLLKSTGDRQELLQRSIKPIQHGRFDRLTIALVDLLHDEDVPIGPRAQQSKTIICTESTISTDALPDDSENLIQKVLHNKQKLLTFDPLKNEQSGIARLYVPLHIDGHVQLVLGAESLRMTPFKPQHEKFLTIAGTQLLVALENIRLAEQTVQLAADAERGRIARDIHDGIAQLTYMLSLQAETCEAQAQRIIEASEEDAELIAPLAERLGKMVTISKQALWETRNYMFSLKPLMSGSTTLTQMLDNQLREFQAISDLPTHLTVEGSDQDYEEQRLHSRRYAQIGTTFFRIVQEALTNAYKHAQATRLEVCLRYHADHIEVDICDNGRGMPTRLNGTPDIKESYLAVEEPHILSGHGMGGMRERAAELGGQFNVLTTPAGGTTIRVSIPL